MLTLKPLRRRAGLRRYSTAKVRTGLGKPDRPGSSGGLGNRVISVRRALELYPNHLSTCLACRGVITVLARMRNSSWSCPMQLTLEEYVLGRLTSNEANDIRAHVRHCPYCKRLVGRIREGYKMDDV